MFYYQLHLRVSSPDFDPAKGTFTSPQDKQNFLDDITQTFERKGFTIEQDEAPWPLAVNGAERVRLSPFGLEGIMAPETCRFLKEEAGFSGPGFLHFEGEVPATTQLYTPMSRTEYANYLDANRADIQDTICSTMRLYGTDLAKGKYRDDSALTPLLQSMSVRNMETGESYQEEAVGFIYTELAQLVAEGRILASDTPGYYRTATKAEQQERQAQEPVL